MFSQIFTSKINQKISTLRSSLHTYIYTYTRVNRNYVTPGTALTISAVARSNWRGIYTQYTINQHYSAHKASASHLMRKQHIYYTMLYLSLKQVWWCAVCLRHDIYVTSRYSSLPHWPPNHSNFSHLYKHHREQSTYSQLKPQETITTHI